MKIIKYKSLIKIKLTQQNSKMSVKLKKFKKLVYIKFTQHKLTMIADVLLKFQEIR